MHPQRVEWISQLHSHLCMYDFYMDAMNKLTEHMYFVYIENKPACLERKERTAPLSIPLN